MARNLVCSECGGKMEMGIIVDVGHGSQPYDASYWMEGAIERGWFGGLKTNKKRKHYISAFRCEHCGFLKLFAGSDHSSEKSN